jgi:putative oxygen-independent coproporphyrinogen III oxidase
VALSPEGPTPGPWSDAPVESGRSAGFGVYLHVPFCRHRCGYCDFATSAVGDDDSLFDRYTDALVTALGAAVDDPDGTGTLPGVRDRTVTSVFVGGGTPSLLGADRLGRVLTALRDLLEVAPDAEVTVECNPEDVSTAFFSGLAARGVDRVSMGAQSFSEEVLAQLERGHDARRPLDAVAEARDAGIERVSLDLIYGAPTETDASWLETVDVAAASGVDHLSAYALTIHDNTPFGTAAREGRMHVDDDVLADRFDLARRRLAEHGFDHYEVSNFSRGASARSRHNVLYWRHGDHLGVGVGAHGHLAGSRWWSTRATARWLEAVESSASPVADRERLDRQQQASERLLLGLRLREGLHPHDVPPIDPLALEEALDAGLVETACGRLRCTDEGWFLLDEAVRRLTVFA